MGKVKIITDENFDKEVLESTDLVLVYFGSTWCSPCAAQLPIVEKLSEGSDLKVVKLDVDDSPETTKYCGVRSVPALFLFKNGKEVASKSGLTSLDQLKKMTETV